MFGRFTNLRQMLLLVLALTLVAGAAAGCAGDRPLPTPSGVKAVLVPGEGDADDIILVSWNASKDSRVDGYVIYRAEQGVGAVVQQKSEFILQPLTFATQYKDDEIHRTEQYPTVRYYYRISVISEEGETGPMSDEVSVEYSPAA